MNKTKKKRREMTQLAAYRQMLWQKPVLKFLFLELTMRCNENCIHCGSRCGETTSKELTLAQYQNFLEQIKADFGTELPMLCVTGGEPLLRSDFFDIMAYAHQLGFCWGMTSNATLIDESVAKKLATCGMRTISVSIDGLAPTHDALRRTKGGYERAMRGIQALLDVGSFESVQVTTVINHKTIGELAPLYDIFKQMEIDSWRIINIEPIGRAKDSPELMLTKTEYQQLFAFIQQKRQEGEPITYGCSHYLGANYEREVRDWYFLCNAGIYTASITTSGEIAACLDIPRLPVLMQGNILRDRFSDVWQNDFQVYRRDLSDTNAQCRQCSEREFCHGGAYHSWNFDENRPELCFRDILF